MSNVLWSLFELAINLFESYLIVEFVSKMQGYKYVGTKQKLTFTIAVLVSFFELNIMNHVVNFEGLAIFFPILTLLIYAKIYLKGDVFKKMFVSVLVMVIIIVINSATAFLMSLIVGANVKQLMSERSISRLVTVIVTKTMFFLLTRSIIKFTKTNKGYSLEGKEWCAVLFSPIISIFFCVQIISVTINFELESKKLNYAFIMLICIVLVNVSNYYLFVKISKNSRAKEELVFLKQRYDYQTKSIDDIKSTYDEIRKLRHDLQNNMFCILALLEQGNYIKATEYASSVSKKIDNIEVFANTDNEAVNCIINLKIKTAKDNGITFKYDVGRKLGTINEVDTCILLANLLDNAIEACQNVKSNEKLIDLKILHNGKSLFIIVKNSVNEPVLKRNPSLITKKKNASVHGLGKLSVKSIIERYDGVLNYYEQENLFCCKTELNFATGEL